MNKPKNCRFWIFINGAPVKLVLAPGQTLELYQFETTDEGWSSSALSWALSSDGQTLSREHTGDGSDCDGRLTSWNDYRASADPETFTGLYLEPDLMRPVWIDAEQTIVDQYAEAAGY